MKLMEGGYSFQNTIASTSTTSPNFVSLLTALYPFESGLRSLSGSAIKNSVDTFPELLRLNGYSTYAEVTGPLVPELGLSKGFDEYNYRDNKTNIHTDWGEKLLTKFKHYKEPWFVLLHIGTLHSKNNSITQYTESLSKIDRYLGRLLMCLNENTIIVFTGDHGESVARSKFEYLSKMIGVRIVKMLRKDKVVTLRRFNPLGHGYSIYDVLVKIPLIFFKKDLVPVGTSRCPG